MWQPPHEQPQLTCLLYVGGMYTFSLRPAQRTWKPCMLPKQPPPGNLEERTASSKFLPRRAHGVLHVLDPCCCKRICLVSKREHFAAKSYPVRNPKIPYFAVISCRGKGTSP